MNKAREDYLLNTPRENLTPAERALQTKLKKYGSISDSLKKRDVGDLILGGFNGGVRTGRKGYATWGKEELTAFVNSRPRDAKGRFLPKEPRDGNGTTTEEHR